MLLREPLKSEPPFFVRSPLQPTRKVEVEAVGRVTATAEAKTSVPSRKAESV
jgi:hypothetical protein